MTDRYFPLPLAFLSCFAVLSSTVFAMIAA